MDEKKSVVVWGHLSEDIRGAFWLSERRPAESEE